MKTDNLKRQLLEELYSYHRSGINPGLERTRKLLKSIGNPEAKLKMIHAAGTNGKGSVCSMIASVLMEAGYKTGLYTSPHILHFNERIRIDGMEISDDDMLDELAEIMPFARETDCTFFEITTALAFKYFCDKNVDVAVIETGMGGRFDSTNVITPLLSIITQIDYDHREFLGNTLEEIATEKAGIIKPDVPVIVGDNHVELMDLFRKKADSAGCSITFCSEKFKLLSSEIDENLNMKVSYSDNDNSFDDIILARAGKHQIDNLFATTATLDILKHNFSITESNFRRGLLNLRRNTGLFGRIELIRQRPVSILDVSHNPGGIKVLTETISDSPYRKIKFNIVFGVMADKDIEGILHILKPICNELVLTHPNLARAIELDKLKVLAKSAGFDSITLKPTVVEAVDYVVELNSPMIITGSFYTAAEAVPVMEKHFTGI